MPPHPLNNFETQIRKVIENKKITTNIFRIQTYNSIMCWYFCIGFINFMLKGIKVSWTILVYFLLPNMK